VALLAACTAMNPDLSNESYVNLVTFRRDGRGVPTPVWFALVGGLLYVFTDGTSAKVKRIRATKRVRIAACDVRGGVTGPWAEGRARVVEEPELVERAYAALREKYGWQMQLVDLVSWVAGRIDRRAILEIEIVPEPA
jgi:PPOX class probable F420-dependent enzyme